MYTYTQRKVYHVHILEYILGDMDKQQHIGWMFSILCMLQGTLWSLGPVLLRCVTLKYEGTALLCIPSSLVIAIFT